MQGILCSMIECSGFLQHDWMQWIFCSMAQSIPIECSGFHAASLNAEDSLHCCAMDPDCIQWRPRSEDKCILSECIGFYAAWHKISRLNAADSMQHDWMQWILCSIAKASRLNAVDSMQRHWMQWTPCSLVKCILFECRGFPAAWLNAVDSMQHEEMEPYRMRGSLCSMIECSGFLQNNWMLWILCSMAKSIPIECSGFHAAWLNAVESMQHDWMQRNHAAW